MVGMSEIQALADRIGQEFNPERIVLFGSRAYGRPREDSDVDVLVILPFSGRPLDVALEILERTNPTFAIDLIARRPDDAARRYAEGDPLIRDAFDHGRVLYERDP